MTPEPDFENMPIEKINQYLRDHGYDPKQVGLHGKILVDALIENMKMREIIQMFLNDPGGCRFCDYGKLRKPGIPEKDHDDDCPYKIARTYCIEDLQDDNKRSKWEDYYPGWGAPAVNQRYIVKLKNGWITIATYYFRFGGGYWKDDRGQELADGAVSLWKRLEE